MDRDMLSQRSFPSSGGSPSMPAVKSLQLWFQLPTRRTLIQRDRRWGGEDAIRSIKTTIREVARITDLPSWPPSEGRWCTGGTSSETTDPSGHFTRRRKCRKRTSPVSVTACTSIWGGRIWIALRLLDIVARRRGARQQPAGIKITWNEAPRSACEGWYESGPRRSHPWASRRTNDTNRLGGLERHEKRLVLGREQSALR